MQGEEDDDLQVHLGDPAWAARLQGLDRNPARAARCRTRKFPGNIQVAHAPAQVMPGAAGSMVKAAT